MRAGGRVSRGALLRRCGEQPAAVASSESSATVASAVAASAVSAATTSSVAASSVTSTAFTSSVAPAVATAVAATHAVAASVAAALLGAGLADRHGPASVRQLVGGHRRLPAC